MAKVKVPTKLRVLRGNPSNRPLPEDVDPEVVQRKTKPPIKMNNSERAKWDRITTNLESVGLLTVMDVDMLARYCKKLVRYDVLSAYIEKHGTVSQRVNNFGPYDVTSEQYRQWVQIGSELLKIEREFGFSPVSRSGLMGPLKGEGKDEWEGFLFSKLDQSKKNA